MGSILYELFIEGYTVKQWGTEPNNLSAEFAPKRIDLRTDNNKNLFKDKWEYFNPEGSGEIIENVLKKSNVELNSEITIKNIDNYLNNFDALVITSALDLYLQAEDVLEWRGIKSEPEYIENLDNEEKHTEAYQINHPSLNEKFTRTIETKHASGQKINGSIVCKEYPGENIRHYPVLSKDNKNKDLNNQYKATIKNNTEKPVYFCGRLANYQYINQDEAIVQGFNAASVLIKENNK